eukprot:3053673-Rhodomonas_salina.1
MDLAAGCCPSRWPRWWRIDAEWMRRMCPRGVVEWLLGMDMSSSRVKRCSVRGCARERMRGRRHVCIGSVCRVGGPIFSETSAAAATTAAAATAAAAAAAAASDAADV